MKKLFSVLSLSLLSVGAQAQFSPYLPHPKQTFVSATYAYQSFDSFWAGGTKLNLPDDVIQQTAGISIEYGIAPRLALDLYAGYVSTEYSPSPTLDGLDDSRIGLRYALTEETSNRICATPALAIRIGGIIEGTYDVPKGLVINSPGTGACGFESSLLFAKTLADSGLTLFGDFGYRVRAEGVPPEIFGSATLSYSFLKNWNLGATYRFNNCLDGPDLFGPGFTTSRLPEIKERQQILQGALTYAFSERYQLTTFVAKTIQARNAGDKFIIGASLGLTF